MLFSFLPLSVISKDLCSWMVETREECAGYQNLLGNCWSAVSSEAWLPVFLWQQMAHQVSTGQWEAAAADWTSAQAEGVSLGVALGGLPTSSHQMSLSGVVLVFGMTWADEQIWAWLQPRLVDTSC